LKKLWLVVCFIFFSCASGPVGGLIFSNIEYAGELNSDQSIPIIAENRGCQYSILHLISFGDSGAGSVANKKGIRRIATIDYSHFSLFHFVFVRNCTIVTGATY